MLLRIDYAKLNVDNLGRLVGPDGRLFSGTWFEENDHNVLLAEGECLSGLQHGVEKSWHDNGQLELQQHWFSGRAHGKAESWFENGQLESIGTFEFGHCLEMTRFSESGDEVFSYNIKDKPDDFAHLQRSREVNRYPPIDELQ